MNIIYSDHATRRMRQRGITELEVEHILTYPMYVKKTFEGKKEAVGTVKNRTIKIVFTETENYLKIITLM